MEVAPMMQLIGRLRPRQPALRRLTHSDCRTSARARSNNPRASIINSRVTPLAEQKIAAAARTELAKIRCRRAGMAGDLNARVADDAKNFCNVSAPCPWITLPHSAAPWCPALLVRADNVIE